MTDLDLYSELMEEEVDLEAIPDIPDSVRAYIQTLQTKFAGLETEFEALSTYVNRLESERTLLIARGEQVINNFSRLGLVGRREIGKLKQRVLYLSKKAHLPEPKFAVSTLPAEPISLNPETQLSYSDLLSYLHSLQSPDKSSSKAQNSQVTNYSTSNESPSFKIIQPERQKKASSQQQQQQQQLFQQSSVDSHHRSPSASSSSSSSSGSESSGSSSSSCSSDSTGALRRSTTRSPTRLSTVESLSSRRQSDQQSVATRLPPNKVTSPQASREIRLLVRDSNSSRQLTCAHSSPQTTPHTLERKRFRPPESYSEHRFRPNNPLKHTRLHNKLDLNRLSNGHGSFRSESTSRGRSPHQTGSRECPRPAEKYYHHAQCEHTAVPYRKRASERLDRAHQTCTTAPLPTTSNITDLRSDNSNKNRGKENRSSVATSSSSSKRTTKPRTPPSDGGSTIGFSGSAQNSAMTVREKKSDFIGQTADHNVDHNRSPDRQSDPSPGSRLDRRAHSSTDDGKNRQPKSTTLYTKRLRSRLEESRADTTVPDTVANGCHADHPQTPTPVRPNQPDQSATESSNVLPDSDHSTNPPNQEAASSPATLPDPVCEPILLSSQPSPALSEPVPILSTSPILNHSYVEESTKEPVNTSPTEATKSTQQPTSSSVEKRKRSAGASSNDNWSSFDEEVLFEANLLQCDSPHAPPADEYNSFQCDEGNKEEGEVGDELDEDDEEVDTKSGQVITDRRCPRRHQQSDRVDAAIRRSWSRSFNSGDTGRSNKRTRVYRSASSSSSERQTINRRQARGPSRRLDPSGWKNSGAPQRIGTQPNIGSSERVGPRRSRSRSMSPLHHRSKTVAIRYNDPNPRSPSKMSRVRTHTSDHSPVIIRDRNRSPSHRDPDSTFLGRSCDSSRSESHQTGRTSHGLNRTERSGYHAPLRSPLRNNNKARFNREREFSNRHRRPLAPQMHSRTSLNPPRFRPRVHSGSSVRPAPRRF